MLDWAQAGGSKLQASLTSLEVMGLWTLDWFVFQGVWCTAKQRWVRGPWGLDSRLTALCSFWCGWSWVRVLTDSGRGADDELSVIYLGESNEVTHSGPHSQGSRGTSLKKGLRDLHLKAAAHKQEDEWTRSNVPLNKSIFSVCTFKEAVL